MTEYEILYNDNGKPGILIRKAIDLHSLMSLLVVDMKYSEFKTIYKVSIY
jgi:hypothetical protein